MDFNKIHGKFKSRGAALVEFAFVFPIAMLLLFSIIDLSTYYYYESSMSHVVRSSLRFAVTGQVKDNNFTTNTTDKLNRLQSILRVAKESTPPLVKFRSDAYAAANPTNYNSDLITFVSTDVAGVVATNATNLGGAGAKVKMIFQQDQYFLTPFPRLLNPNNVGSNRITITTVYKTERYE